MIAISGELPSDSLRLFHRNIKYARTVMYDIRDKDLMRIYYRDKIRGYRLTPQAKAALLKQNPSRFSPYLTGLVETNRIKNTPIRRQRLHCLGEVNIMMTSSEVAVFPDQKPAVFAPDAVKEQKIQSAAFYSSREIKQMDKENTIKLSGSQMAGVLLTPANAYITYNSRKELLDLDYRYEQRCHTLVSGTLCNNLPNLQYEPENICGLMFAKNLSAIRHILYTENTNLRDFFLLDGDYHHFYYLTTDHYGEIMLRLIASPQKQESLNRILRQDLIPSKTIVPFDCDGIDRNGLPVLFGYLLDFPRINRFSTSLKLHEKNGIVICFDFQRNLLAEFMDSRISLQSISFEKFERSFFPSKNTNS